MTQSRINTCREIAIEINNEFEIGVSDKELHLMTLLIARHVGKLMSAELRDVREYANRSD